MPPPDRIRFHLDESCTPSLAPGLRLRGIDVTTTQEAGLLGRPDDVQLSHALAAGHVLVTHDSDFINLQHQGASHAGIVDCRQHRYTLGEIIRRLALIWDIDEPADFAGRLEYL
jgi:predicted nuclease of predicted toxin-antitoxin system